MNNIREEITSKFDKKFSKIHLVHRPDTIPNFQHQEFELQHNMRKMLIDFIVDELETYIKENFVSKETYLKNNSLECEHDYKPDWLGVDTFEENIKTTIYDRKLKQCSICGHIESK